MLKMILIVPVIMGCALAGTVGLMKAIKKFCPNQFKDSKTTTNTSKEERS